MYVHLKKKKKFKIAAISSFLNLYPNFNSMKWAELHKEQRGENQILILILVMKV